MSASLWSPSGFIGTLLASAINFLQAGVGAVVRSVQDKLRDTYHVKDFGIVADAALDQTIKLQAALDALPNYAVLDLGGLTIKLSKGINNLIVYPNQDQPCVYAYNKNQVTIRNGKLLVPFHGLGAFEGKSCPGLKLENLEAEGYGNFPPIDGTTGRAEKGTATEGYYYNLFDFNGNPRNNSVNTSAFSTGGYGGAFPREGGGTGATWGTWGGGYIQNQGHGFRLDDCDGAVVSKVKASKFNGSGLSLKDSRKVFVTANCDFSDNYIAGIECASDNTKLDCSLTVHAIQSSRNGHPNASLTHLNIDPGYGIATNNGANPYQVISVSQSEFYGNKRKGIDSHSCKTFFASLNYIEDTTHGINVYAGPGSTLESAILVSNKLKRICNAKGSNTLGISIAGADSARIAKAIITSNDLEDVGVAPAIVDIAVPLSSYAIHVANSESSQIANNNLNNKTYIGQCGIVTPQSTSQPDADVTASSNTIKGKFKIGVLGATDVDLDTRPLYSANRLNLSSILPYTDTHIGISSQNATVQGNSIRLPNVAGSLLYSTGRKTGLQLVVNVVITAGAITYTVESNFEQFGRNYIASVTSVASGLRLTLDAFLPPARKTFITKKTQIVKRVSDNALINSIFERDVQATYVEIGLAIEDYTAKTSTSVAANAADGVINVTIEF